MEHILKREWAWVWIEYYVLNNTYVRELFNSNNRFTIIAIFAENKGWKSQFNPKRFEIEALQLENHHEGLQKEYLNVDNHHAGLENEDLKLQTHDKGFKEEDLKLQLHNKEFENEGLKVESYHKDLERKEMKLMHKTHTIKRLKMNQVLTMKNNELCTLFETNQFY